MEENRKGFAPILFLLIIVVIIVGLLIFKNQIKVGTPGVSPVPTVTFTDTPTPSPTPSLTPSPTIKPTNSPTHIPTLPPYTGSVGNGFSSFSVNTEKGSFNVNALAVNLTNTKIITDTANDSDCANNCSVMNLASFVSKNGGFAGVNGSYFCPASYPECSGKTNSFDFPVYNSRLNKWINAGNLFWNGRSMFYVDGSGAHFLQNANSFGGSLTAGITNYPGLIDNGNVQIDDNQSGLSDKQKAVGTKVGIGVKDNNNVIVVIAFNVNMQQFAYVFKALGAKGALNLDTGGSTALYYNGRYMAGPGRDIPNAIIFANK